MKRFGLFLAGAAGVFSSELPILMEWEEWKAHFEADRLFTASGLEHERKSQFEANIEKIKSHNARHANGEVGYKLGVNQFADLSPEEFADVAGLTLSAKHRPVRTAPRNPLELDVSDTPTSVDWRSKGGVTAVKNQGQCGSCWSFSSTGAMEGNLFAETGTLVSLSEKMLMDCSTENHSCNGGLMDYAFEFVISNGGIDTEADYPYQPEDGTCDRTKEANHAAKFTGYHDVLKNNVDQLKAAVALNPVSVAIEADKEAFQLYRSGVLDKESCGTQLDHGVLVVGFTAEDDPTYPNAWIVKNSWAATWGVAGYIYISRTTQYSDMGICGILQDPSYPTGGSVGPSPAPGPTPAPGSEFYENPYIVHECGDNEAPLTLSTAGKLCSPKCTVDADCPANPTGFSGTPRCSITDQMTQQKYCAIECNYSQAECGSAGGADTSHGGAECEVYCDGSATGCQWMCLYQGADWKTSLVERINREQVQIALE